MSSNLLNNLKDNKKLENICSIDNNDSNNICLSNDVIEKLNNLDTKVCEDNNKECLILNKEKIVNNTADSLGCSGLNRDICIVNELSKRKIINSDEEKYIKFNDFKPYSSINPIDWLSNDDIDMVQEQLYKKYKNYYYSYIHMIDLVMVGHNNSKLIGHSIKNIKDIDFCKELNNISYSNRISIDGNELKSYGVVCNTDSSSSGGQHWFSMYFNFNSNGTLQDPYTLEYFNSSGHPIVSKSFRQFFLDLENKLTKQLKKCVKFIQVTNIQHQGLEPGLGEKSGNCGLYSLYYIWSRLENIPYTYFNEKQMILSDKIITEFRKKLFRRVY